MEAFLPIYFTLETCIILQEDQALWHLQFSLNNLTHHLFIWLLLISNSSLPTENGNCYRQGCLENLFSYDCGMTHLFLTIFVLIFDFLSNIPYSWLYFDGFCKYYVAVSICQRFRIFGDTEISFKWPSELWVQYIESGIYY